MVYMLIIERRVKEPVNPRVAEPGLRFPEPFTGSVFKSCFKLLWRNISSSQSQTRFLDVLQCSFKHLPLMFT